MSHRAHLFSLRIANAFRESCIQQRYTRQRFLQDMMAGMTVGVIAIPLAMALAIASGVAPQHGLYTAIIAGFVIAFTGGSRFSISGPTAAFVVILFPILQAHGLGGLLVAGLMSGFILIGMALLRLGRYIEYISESVTLGFTGGIAVVIATLQLKDFLGLTIREMPESYIGKVSALAEHAASFSGPSVVIAGMTLLVMLVWPRLKTPVPPHLPAIIVGSLLAWALGGMGYGVDTIGSRFHYALVGGGMGEGIPPYLPHFVLPWNEPGLDGKALALNWHTIESLLPAAMAIAMLGAIESLLCAVVLDGMTGTRHSANSELLGQGIGNIITPFLGGITATAAIARSAANYRAGAQSPVAAMLHAVVVLLGLVILAPLLAYLPMPAMAALLMVVAWNMSEAPKSLHLVKTASKNDVLVFATCLLLTVFFDMVIAISVGIVLASLLFMQEIAEMTQLKDISKNKTLLPMGGAPDNWRVVKINGPLFFAAADKVFGELSQQMDSVDGVVIYMGAVPMLDAGGVSALTKFLDSCRRKQKQVSICDLQFQPLRTLHRSHLKPETGLLVFSASLADALAKIATTATPGATQ